MLGKRSAAAAQGQAATPVKEEASGRKRDAKAQQKQAGREAPAQPSHQLAAKDPAWNADGILINKRLIRLWDDAEVAICT